MFNRSSAFIICADGTWAKSFHTVVAEIGFGHIEHIGETKQLSAVPFSRPLQFCFLTQASTSEEIRLATKIVRGHKHERHRFSPMIMLARELSRPAIYDYIAAGLDDILQFPCSLKFMSSRLGRQLNRQLKYYETEDYFGPDRRRHHDDAADVGDRRVGQSDFRRHLIRRDPFKGVEILDVYDHQADAQNVQQEQAG
jgi:hypothetical protein